MISKIFSLYFMLFGMAASSGLPERVDQTEGEVFVKKAGSIPGYFVIKCKNYPLFYESFTLPPGRPGGFFREICPWRCPYAF